MQSSIFKEFYKKWLYTMVPSSVWWTCLATFTKRQYIGRYFSEVRP